MNYLLLARPALCTSSFRAVFEPSCINVHIDHLGCTEWFQGDFRAVSQKLGVLESALESWVFYLNGSLAPFLIN